jgi:hypothetical protein
MAIRDRNLLKSWFERGDKPLASQFADWIDSYWHKNDTLPMSVIENLGATLNEKAETVSLNNEIASRIAGDNHLQTQIDNLEIPEPVQSDWDETDADAPEYILNKPGAATQTEAGLMSAGDKTKLDGIDDGAEVNVQSDWNQTDNSADDYIKNKPTIPPDLSAEVAALQSISVIRGNVDTHAALLALATTGMRVNDSYIVEQDENHGGNSAIYTWDGTGWNFTHLWEVNLNIKYGTYTVGSTEFTFSKFAAINGGEEFDVLEVSTGDSNYTIVINAAAGNLGDTRIMLFNVGAGYTITLSFVFAHKLVEGGELILTAGVHAVTLLRGSTNLVNIAPYN